MAKVFLPLFRGSYLYSSYLFFLYSLSLSYQRLKVQVLYLLFNAKMDYVSLLLPLNTCLLKPSPLILSKQCCC